VPDSEDYGPSTYGERWAAIYDSFARLPTDTDATVEFLAGLAGEGPVLELGIGTGRVALPLAERGVEVHGIDASEAMVAKLREKPGGARISVTMGDFADVGTLVQGPYSLVFVAFNTFFALLTQEDQIRCFQGVAQVLGIEGVFVIRAFVPDPTFFDRGSRVGVASLSTDETILDVAQLDQALQQVTAQHVMIRDGQISTFPVKLRYAWPSELDLMARLAGMRLRERWGGWQREPFGSSSQNHVSVYEQAPG
jgi:SAM-dependent methyltransferase